MILCCVGFFLAMSFWTHNDLSRAESRRELGAEILRRGYLDLPGLCAGCSRTIRAFMQAWGHGTLVGTGIRWHRDPSDWSPIFPRDMSGAFRWRDLATYATAILAWLLAIFGIFFLPVP